MKTGRALAFFLAFIVLHLPASGRIVQLAELTAADGAAGDQFGFAVAASDDTIVVGTSPFLTSETGVYVFMRSGSSWVQVAKLTDNVANDGFGGSVAISSNTIVAGAPGAGNGQGAVYVFVKPAGGWRDMTPTAEFNVPLQLLAQKFGDSVAISSDETTIVGGGEGDGGIGSGAAYVFVKPTGGWQDTSVPTATLSSTLAKDLGKAVAISGNTIVASSIGVNSQGSAYVFIEPPGGWQDAQPTATLTPSDGGQGDQFGSALAIYGNTIVAGFDVYVYVKPAGGWRDMTQTAKLMVSTKANGGLGSSVAIVGGVVVAGAPGDVIGHTAQGSSFGYLEPPGGWKNTSKPNAQVIASDGAAQDSFGASIALSPTICVVGAPGHNGLQGAAYIFGRQ
jgi:hypothetical protein